MKKSLTKMIFQRYLPVAKLAWERKYDRAALKSQKTNAKITKRWRHEKYVGPVSRTAKAVPNAMAIGRTETMANIQPELSRRF